MINKEDVKKLKKRIEKILKKYGLLKKGTHQLTKKGRKKLAKHYKEPKKVREAKIRRAMKRKRRKK